ncbi:MAG: MarR family transcriptional regulator [Sphingomonadaceae bacterium]|jgi:DNA-binding MarR family transcriptional regulator|nr:MarR family transcriptional regulator [Sphingomonadaceae bacterium]NBU79116.1 MarR family transcriptional regulator [Sphingomonadaceae bacterium]
MIGLYHTTRQIEAELNIRALSLEFEIVLCLFEQGPLSASEIIDIIHASQAGFNHIARRLLADGILVSTRSEVDRRMTLYSVSPQVVKVLSGKLSRFKRA